MNILGEIVSILCTDALALGVTDTLTAMILTMLYTEILFSFHQGWFWVPMPTKCWEIVHNVNISYI